MILCAANRKEREGIELLLLGILGEVAKDSGGEITWSSGEMGSGWNSSFALLFLSLWTQAHIGGWVGR